MPTQQSFTGFETRDITPKEIPLLLSFIQSLAEYEKRPEDCTATGEKLHRALFVDKTATAQLAWLEGRAVGYAIFYPVFGSFSAGTRLYLEDLFIEPALRGRGFGREFLRRVAAEAVSRGYCGMKWSCLDWNAPSIAFYEGLGAKQENGVLHFSFEGDAYLGFVNER